jgi:hypothetical protein
MRTSTLLFALCCSLMPIGIAATSHQRSNERVDREKKCKRVEAGFAGVPVTENCDSPVAFCGAGVITGNGLISGTFRSTVFGFAPSVGLPGLEPETTLAYAGERTIDTVHGSLTLRFTGVYDTARAEFSELERVTAGTRRFDDATGTMWITGTSNATATVFEGSITGQLCVAR